MSKKYIVSVGYNDLLVPSAEVALSILDSIPVSDKKIDGVYKFYPNDLKLSLKSVDESLVLDKSPVGPSND